MGPASAEADNEGEQTLNSDDEGCTSGCPALLPTALDFSAEASGMIRMWFLGVIGAGAVSERIPGIGHIHEAMAAERGQKTQKN